MVSVIARQVHVSEPRAVAFGRERSYRHSRVAHRVKSQCLDGVHVPGPPVPVRGQVRSPEPVLGYSSPPSDMGPR